MLSYRNVALASAAIAIAAALANRLTRPDAAPGIESDHEVGDYPAIPHPLRAATGVEGFG
jgi:hypothetical protein